MLAIAGCLLNPPPRENNSQFWPSPQRAICWLCGLTYWPGTRVCFSFGLPSYKSVAPASSLSSSGCGLRFTKVSYLLEGVFYKAMRSLKLHLVNLIYPLFVSLSVWTSRSLRLYELELSNFVTILVYIAVTLGLFLKFSHAPLNR